MKEKFLTENNGVFIEATADGRAKSSTMPDYDQFVQDRGWEFGTDEELNAAYQRLNMCRDGLIITEDQFIAEAGKHYDTETLKYVYAVLEELVSQKKLYASEVYRYAHFKWCLQNEKAIVAYQESQANWIVNNCDTEITEEKAIVEVNSEWGFEASRIEIVDTPYYESTDWQFIRFDCAHMTWLWKNGNLYQVYS